MKAVGAVIALTALAVVVLACLRWFQPAAIATANPPAAAVPTSHDCPECSQLLEQITELRRELRAMKSQLPSQQYQPGASVSEPGPADRFRGPADMEAARAEAMDQHRLRVAETAQVFATEKNDPAWATYASSRIDAVFASDEALRGLAHDIQCRGKTCRLRIDDDGSGNLSQRLLLVALGLADVLPTISADHVEQGDGRSTTTLYLSSEKSVGLSR